MQFNAGIGPVFPARCVICSRQPASELDLCASCLGHLAPRVRLDKLGQSALCRRCGAELREAGCRTCAEKLPLYAHIACPYRYAFPLDRMIHSLKYGHDRVMGRVLGELLAFGLGLAGEKNKKTAGSEVKLRGEPEIVIPVPLHATRQASRGFNHAADIARFAAKRLQLPYSDRLSRRIEDTGSLAGLSRAEREQRIRGAFQVSETLADKRVVIVDDVMTTGATSGELARELYDTGAASVELWVVARTPAD